MTRRRDSFGTEETKTGRGWAGVADAAEAVWMCRFCNEPIRPTEDIVSSRNDSYHYQCYMKNQRGELR